MSPNQTPSKQINHRSVRSPSDTRGNSDSLQSTTAQLTTNDNNNDNILIGADGNIKEPEVPSIKFEPSTNSSDSFTFVVKMDPKIPPPKDNTLVHSVTGLRHFTSYSIEIRACHGLPNNPTNITTATLAPDYNRCSLQAITITRTSAMQGADSINKTSINIQPKNETSPYIVSWEEPKNPNGLVLAYLVRYRHADSSNDVWAEGCINRTSYEASRGFNLYNLSPAGLYKLQVRSISMAPISAEWSKIVEFHVKDECK